jgi:hypothetical protein
LTKFANERGHEFALFRGTGRDREFNSCYGVAEAVFDPGPDLIPRADRDVRVQMFVGDQVRELITPWRRAMPTAEVLINDPFASDVSSPSITLCRRKLPSPRLVVDPTSFGFVSIQSNKSRAAQLTKSGTARSGSLQVSCGEP